MRIAIPLAGDRLSPHFGHCDRFALVDVDAPVRRVLRQEEVEAPPHQPGLLPAWLAQQGVTVVLAGGMGQRAQGLFTQHGIVVVVGVPSETPKQLVAQYLAGNLQAGDNVCDH